MGRSELPCPWLSFLFEVGGYHADSRIKLLRLIIGYTRQEPSSMTRLSAILSLESREFGGDFG